MAPTPTTYRQEATMTTTQPASCPDCGGPTRQAFATTTAYVACRRCGHVHPAELDVAELGARIAATEVRS